MEWATATESNRFWPFFQNLWMIARPPYRAESEGITTYSYSNGELLAQEEDKYADERKRAATEETDQGCN